MTDSTFPARLTATKSMLNDTLTTMFQQYQLQQTNLAAYTKQKAELEAEVVSLRAKLESVKMAADTHDREFLDRVREPPVKRRLGLMTLQDWVFAAFFTVYTVVSLAVLVYTLLFSTKKLTAGFIVLSTSVILGVMIAAVIRRFA